MIFEFPSGENLARAEQDREASIRPDLARYSVAAGGGVVVGQAPGHWANRWIRAGMSGAVTEEDVDIAEAFWVGIEASGSVTTCAWTDDSLIRHLRARGYTITDTHRMFARAVEPIVLQRPTAPGLVIEQLDPSDPIACMHHLSQMSWGFGDASRPVRAMDVEVGYRITQHPRHRCFLARLNGEVVGASTLELTHDRAAFFGSTVTEKARGIGIQGEFFKYRMNVAIEANATVSIVGSVPNGPTTRTAARCGFTYTYETQSWCKPPT